MSTVVKRLTSGVHEQQSSSGRTVVVGCDGAAMRPAGSGADATGATAEAASLPPVTVAGMSRLQTPADQGCRHAEMRMGTRADGRGGWTTRSRCLPCLRPASVRVVAPLGRAPGQRSMGLLRRRREGGAGAACWSRVRAVCQRLLDSNGEGQQASNSVRPRGAVPLPCDRGARGAAAVQKSAQASTSYPTIVACVLTAD